MAINHASVPDACGVYRIRNIKNGKIYIGSSLQMRRRAYLHKRSLRIGDHHSAYLQRAWNKHGEDFFVFEPLIICSPDLRNFYEQKIINGLDSAKAGTGYNGTGTVVSGDKNSAWTEERKRAHVAARLGKSVFRNNPEAHKNLMEAVHRGKKHHMYGRSHTEESKRKISENRKGKVAWNKGIPSKRKGLPRSEEDRKRISDGLIKSARRKLSRDQVVEIRNLRNEQLLSHRELARRYSISQSTVHLILSGVNWAHVKEGLPCR